VILREVLQVQVALLTGVGASEEQARKVVAVEASRCGEDK
jgi:hypothetical protein